MEPQRRGGVLGGAHLVQGLEPQDTTTPHPPPKKSSQLNNFLKQLLGRRELGMSGNWELLHWLDCFPPLNKWTKSRKFPESPDGSEAFAIPRTETAREDDLFG